MENQEELTKQMEKICKIATSKTSLVIFFLHPKFILSFGFAEVRIATHSTDFVNKVLDKVKSGVPDGGIDDL